MEHGDKKRGKADPAEVLALVTGVASELHPGRTFEGDLDSRLDRDFGLDSLGRVEVLQRLERAFQVILADTVLVTAETPRDLLRAVLAAGSEVSRIPVLPSGPTAGPGAAGEAPVVPRGAATLIEVLDWHAERHPGRPHVRFFDDREEGRTLGYGELRDGARRAAVGLQALGVGGGEAVMIMLPSGSDYFVTFFGALLAGGVPVPVYPPARPSQIEEHIGRQAGIAANSLSGVLVTTPEIKPVAGLLKARVETLRSVTTPAELAEGGGGGLLPKTTPDATAFLQYTSGSTGNPKGVVLTHANLLANIRAMGEALAVTPGEDVFVSWLPLYHDMGLIGAWLGPLYHGVPLVLMSPLAFLAKPFRWLAAIHRHRGTLSAAPNFAYDLCRRQIDERDLEGLDLSSWRVALNGAEPVSPETLEGFSRRFAPRGFRPESLMPVYGLAECSVGLAFPPLGRMPPVDPVSRERFQRNGIAEPAGEGEPGPLRFAACGRPLPGHEIRIVDAGGRELPERHEGRIQFRGPSATSGYFRNPEATRALFQEGWADTGDLGYIAAGDIHITGRVKDMIVRGGRNIYPAELEDAVGALEGIRRGCVAAFASPDPGTGSERLVVLAETRRQSPENKALLEARIHELAIDIAGLPPDEVVLAPPNTVPHTSSGKIRRAASREIFERGLIGRPRRALWRQVAAMTLATGLPGLRRLAREGRAVAFAARAWTLFGLAAPPLWLLATLWPGAKARWRAASWLLRLIARGAGLAIAVKGLENRRPSAIIVANHASYLDVFVLTAALPEPVRFVAKRELAGSWATRVPLERLGVVFVERFDAERSVSDAGEAARAAAGEGPPLLFFPEGTFFRAPGLRPFHMGAFVAAVEAGIPVVPLVLRGTRSALRAGQWFPRRAALSVTLLPAIAPATEGEPWTRAIMLRDAVRETILRYCGEPDLS